MALVLRLGVAVAATLVLLAPALWNGFPLLQYDTGGYLARWFEGYLVPSRSVVYGLFVAAGWPLDFWPVIVLQSAAGVWIVWLVLRTHQIGPRPGSVLAIVTLLALTTALPWLAGVLLTDIFAGLAILALHLLLMRDAELHRAERAALVVFIAFSAATHSATFLVLAGLTAAALLLSIYDRNLMPRPAVWRAAAALVLGAAVLLAANYALAKRLAWTPGGYGIAFGRMLQDGIVARYLDDHCPDVRLRLCPYRHVIPQDADKFLWGQGVFNQLGRFDGLGAEMRTIVLESLRAYPWLQAKAAAIATAEQLVSVRTGEGFGTDIWHTYGMMEMHTPSVLPAMRAARQQRGQLDFSVINTLHLPVAFASMALLPIIILFARRRREFGDLGYLGATIALAILGNAVVCGALANPHDRYGSRIAWLAPLAVVLVAWRIRAGAPAQRTIAVPASTGGA